MSPTRSGLAMLPVVVGLFTTSISSGLLISKTGRYKIFPVIGSAILIVALSLLGTIAVDTPYWRVAVYAAVFGLGLGLTLQTVVVAVQNSVDIRDMGVATSSTTFFRSLGGAIGAATFGAVLGIRLDGYLEERLGAAAADVDVDDIQAIRALPDATRDLVLAAYTDALNDVFLACVPFIVIALVIALTLREVPLRSSEVPYTAPPVDPETALPPDLTATPVAGRGPLPGGAATPERRESTP